MSRIECELIKETYSLRERSKPFRANRLKIGTVQMRVEYSGINVVLPRYSGTLITIIYVYDTPVYVACLARPNLRPLVPASYQRICTDLPPAKI